MALFIGDTVIVSDEGAANILTPSKKKIKNIAIFLKDADSSAEEVEVPDTLPDPESFGRGRRTAVLDQKLRQDSTAEEKRKSHQRELMEKMNDAALRRIKEGMYNLGIQIRNMKTVFNIYGTWRWVMFEKLMMKSYDFFYWDKLFV